MGSSGGGGGAGVVDYPAHMKEFHYDVLSQDGADSITSSMVDVMNTMLGASPFSGEVAYDPDADIAANAAVITAFAAILAGINEPVDWAALYTQAQTSITIAEITDAEILVDSAAFGASLDDQINTVVLPRFEGGMRDINAVVSSAFVLGKANIEGFRDRDVAKHESGLRIEAVNKNAAIRISEEQTRVTAAGQMLQLLIQKYSWEEVYTKMVIESNRIKIVAKKEEAEVNLNIDEADANWDIGVFQPSANMLAAIGGGTMSSQKKQSTASSVIGGALTGVAAGAQLAASSAAITGPVGIGVGAVLGIASAFF